METAHWNQVKNLTSSSPRVNIPATELTYDDLVRLSRDVILYHWGHSIVDLWFKLPLRLQQDPLVLGYLPCFEHYNRSSWRDHIDGPPSPRHRCHSCQTQNNYTLD